MSKIRPPEFWAAMRSLVWIYGVFVLFLRWTQESGTINEALMYWSLIVWLGAGVILAFTDKRLEDKGKA